MGSKVHGTCRWCHHNKRDHRGIVAASLKAAMPRVRWTTTACSVGSAWDLRYAAEPCACRRYEV